MFKISKVAVLVGSLLPASLFAQTIEGTVINSKGEKVVGAKIEVEGTAITTTTDKNGRFVVTDLTSGKRELHITAAGFAHLIKGITISENTSNLTFTLNRSPIEVVDVVASPVHMSVMESATPVTVLAGETLRRQQASTLGDSLEKTVGVHTNFHANVASTPIIRGLSGPRVMISQNGLDVSDVSRVGPDHAVAAEASTATQIEVLRGPATLFYGSGAVGGVVNVVDGRVPTDSTTRGEWSLETNSADNKKLASFNATTGTDSFAFYADGYWRESSDYEVPVAPEADHDEHGDNFKVENSAEESDGFTIGASYLFNDGYLGISVEKFNREYGIPGHSHGDEGDTDDHDHDLEESHSENEDVFADLEQTRVQLQGEINFDGQWLRQVNLRSGFTDYQHSEIEHGEVGTVFENDSHEVKVDLLHHPLSGWKGGLSLHYKNSEVAAQGAEAFTPPSDSETFALAVMEERHLNDDLLLQVGARVEQVTLKANEVLLPELAAHSHDDDHEHDEHDEHDTDHIRVFDVDHEFTPVTLSTGLVWNFTPGYNIGISLSRSERAPSATELLSFGPHIGTGSYEIGALFALHQENDHRDIGLTDEAIDLETANNIDLTFRKTQGEVAYIFNAFYNKIDNYYYQINTGLFAESGHDHSDDSHDHDEHTDELPVYIFQTDDVILKGFEAQIAWQATDEIKATVFSDYVRVKLQDGGDLPRTPPLRFGTNLSYINENISAHLDITRYQSQDKITAFETETDGYTLVDASVSYDLPMLNHDISLYVKGSNLTDTEARVHSSFLKDIAPRPGRSFSVGIRGYF
ncbi:TonB-dependent receptor [Thalassotalea sp. 1_MG-2023]|uniref:TonB-dependent receptor n=1 Tax=Thalassotalea sp. 1_MG-2023 TaxID=3062680 RepID=UPI0026E33701|nr:TonB-dependent receptor [Thalassotalea sp. 1_MG-2023]MDO6427704.1 TonB-dependent receptor [Thalassotalea sp. 1_MG-2023]